MKLTYRATAFITAIAFLLCSCATTKEPGKETQWSSPQACIAAHTVGGALVGALTGVLIAAATGGRGKIGQGAAIGSAAGGALAFAYAWGSCFAAFTKVTSAPSQSYSTARSRTGYQPSQGTLVQIRHYSIDPSAIAPGEKPAMHALYYVMTPKEEDVTVTETLALRIYNPKKGRFEDVGETSETIVVSPGERKATSEIPVPPNAENGKFLFVFRVTVQGHKAEKEMPLTITNDEAILAEARRDHALRQSELASLYNAPSVASQQARTVVADSGSKDVASVKDKQIMVTVNKANIRENPNVKAKIVAKASQGNTFTVVESVAVKGKQWHHIRLGNGKLAWITASACKLVE